MTKINDTLSTLAGRTSFALSYPEGMPGVLTEIIDALNSSGYLVNTEPLVSQKEVEALVSSLRKEKVYHTIKSQRQKVWDTVKPHVESGNLMVIGMFHEPISVDLPDNVLVFDLGKSIRSKVPKQVVTNIIDSVTNPGHFPSKDFDAVYVGLKALCYEVVYDSEQAIFPKSLRKVVYPSVAFDFLANSPDPLNPTTCRAAVIGFLRSVHGNMG